ncbi:transcriptional repressor LexA [Desulfosudis oleivorans]|uniref:LexA repressor n=1 Tax=Desulfosudis oleivorans (strain DSM 6200 / JCM 39069 / Hxd3) TaxID=96561 RepID=A8ZS26_DESOH|nr:transcriptional repressor LexA [Desulfosudis oleivorans]ABW66044.1 transcriptional repressor, LexA family [Desulfosudis oleivorans Hxd3]
MRDSLTARQQQVLEYFQHEIAETGASPSLRQAADALSVSHTAISQALKLLEKKGYITRHGRYSRDIHVLNPMNQSAGMHRWREIPVIGAITAGLPMYAQQEWEGTLVLDRSCFPGDNLFALRVKGDSMKDAAILDGDLVICEPRQFAENGEIVVALVNGEEATVKRFFKRQDHIELKPENPAYAPLKLMFGDVLIQGKVIGLHRDQQGLV